MSIDSIRSCCPFSTQYDTQSPSLSSDSERFTGSHRRHSATAPAVAAACAKSTKSSLRTSSSHGSFHQSGLKLMCRSQHPAAPLQYAAAAASTASPTSGGAGESSPPSSSSSTSTSSGSPSPSSSVSTSRGSPSPSRSGGTGSASRPRQA